MMMKYSLLLTLSIITLSIQAQVEKRSYYQDPGLVPVEHSVDMKHLKLEVSFEAEKKLVKGTATEKFEVLQKSVDSIELNAVRIDVDHVKHNGKDLRYKNSGKQLTLFFEPALKWGTEHEIEIKYEATPSKGLYFIGWDDTTGRSRKQIWTQGQGIDNRHWIPMFDEKNDKLVTEVIVDFDENFKVLSNGEKLKEKNIKDGMKRWHYEISKPHASYLIMLGIGDYAIESRKSASGVNMDLYYYPDQADQLEPTYKYSVEMFDFFEKEIGVSYPWETYSQIPVQDFMYGAMENTTATIFGDFYLVDERAYLDRNYVRVNAHELAHQWFGDMVTAPASAHHWLQESFATHYDMMYQGEAFGEDYFNWVRRNYNNQALSASKSDLKPIAHSQAGTVRHYPKGAFVLQMLKYVVGREQFNATIKYYLEKHAYQNVNSNDLLVAFHERLGLSLNWFWEQWVYKGGEPHYQVDFNQYEAKAIFSVKQVHEQNDLVGLFRMPINFKVVFEDGTESNQKVWIENQSHQVEFDLPEGKKVRYVLFDPNSEVMKEVDFQKSTQMLQAQAQKAEFMIDRYDAIQELVNREFEGKEDFLMARFEAEDFFGIKAEIVKHIVPQLNEVSEKLAKMAINDSDVEVRKSVLESTLRVPESLEPEYRKLLNDKSYEVIEQALEILGFYYPVYVEEYLEITKEKVGSRSHNVRIQWLQLAYHHQQKDVYLNELVDYTSNSYEFLTRVNAAKALKELNTIDEAALGNLLNASMSFNSRLRGPIRGVLDHFYEQDQFKTMILNYVASQNWSDAEFNKVKKYLFLD